MVSRLSTLTVYRILLLTTALMVGGIAVWYTTAWKQLIPSLEKNLTAITEQRTQALQTYVQKQEQALRTFIEQAETIAILAGFTSQAIEPELATSRAKMANLLHSYRFILPYKNFLVINPSGIVLFSNDLHYQSANLTEHPHAQSALTASFIRVAMSLTPDIAEFTYNETLGQPALFICTPVLLHNKLHAIIAMRIDETALYSITYDYLGLGLTGETVLVKTLRNGIIFLNNTRNDATAQFKKYIPFAYAKTKETIPPIQNAALGNSGSGVKNDYAHVPTISSWCFIPKLDWGLVSKIPLAEAQQRLKLPRQLFLIAVLFFLGVLITMLTQNTPLNRTVTQVLHSLYNTASQSLYQLLVAATLCMICICSGMIYFFTRNTQHTLKKTEELIHNRLHEAQHSLDQVLKKTALLTYALGYDLGFQRLKKEDILIRLARELQQNPHIVGISVAYAPYQYHADKKLFAPFMYREKDGSFKTVYLNELYDYTEAKERDVAYRAFYLATLETKDLVWLTPRIDEITDQFVAPASQQFYPHNNPQYASEGVVTVLLNMNAVNTVVEAINVSPTGYAYLLSAQGSFLYHPHYSYAKETITLADMGRRQGSTKLIEIQKKSVAGETGFYTYFDAEHKERKAIYFVPVPSTNWSLGVLFPEQEGASSPITIRRFQMWFVLALTILMMCTLAVMLDITNPHRQTAWSFFLITTIPLSLCFILFIYLINGVHIDDRNTNALMRDPVGLKHFLQDQTYLAEIVRNKRPLHLPTGIAIRTIDLKGLNVAVSGYLWQKYDKTAHAHLERAIIFPQAVNNPTFLKLYEEDIDNTVTIGWQFSALLAQELDYTQYPFDAKRINILLEHPNAAKNVLLTPDFQDYRDILPTALPGTYPYLEIPGFTVIQSTFAYSQIPQKTNRGLSNFNISNVNTALSFEVLCKRGTLNALIEFLLPVFIILFAIYVIFCIGETQREINSMYISTAYTGMLLSMIFLHRSLRERYSTGGALYIEFFFFLAYVTIFILVFHTMLKSSTVGEQPWYKSIFRIYRHYFWQLQLTLSILVTMITFY